MPPVTKTGMSANSDAIIVPATVVAPSLLAATTAAMSLLDVFMTPFALAKYSISSCVNPTVS